jgi:hypothetical protein
MLRGLCEGYVTYGRRDALLHVGFYFLICCHMSYIHFTDNNSR